MSRDGAVTAAGVRSSSSGIVIAGDRTGLRAAARKHTRHVRFLKLSLPASALCIAGLYSISVMQTLGMGDHIPALQMPKIIPENLAMQNPHYEGYNKDGGKYWVKADQAQQDLGNLQLIKLTGISGEITDANKQRTKLKATRGTFDNKTNVLELYDAIDVTGDNGLSAHLTRATVQTKDNVITSIEPVVVAMSSGRITSNRMTARQKAKEYTFVENVKTRFKGHEGDGTPQQAKGTQLVGQSNGPVEVASNRLDIDDNKKVALFTGDVTAVQDGATLTTPELEVHYDGGAPAKGDGKGDSQAGTVTRLIAKDPVVVRQANGNTITSRNADFAPLTKRALFDGEVVMEQGPDKRVTADVADVDQGANTVLLTGDVTVQQGGNQLNGRRLVFNQQTSEMQLTAPGPTAAGGRISARFKQNGAQRGSTQQAQDSDRKGGIAFGATFKTDPNAPVDIEAARLDVNDAAKRAVFTGDVRAVQGDFILGSSELTASYSGSAALAGSDDKKLDAAQITKIVARSKVVVTSKDGQKATGDWADFDPKANTAVLGGNVVLTQGENIVRGTKLVIDMNTGESVIKTEAAAGARTRAAPNGTATAESKPTGRPSAIFYPGKIKANVSKKKTDSIDGWQTRAKP
jgi:lipopolysaccharide transport protein LptA/LPS export ABC transporter protein LptC